ncbi:MAG TPA: pyridoxal-phosphate dependent enzyme, partial [Candidatus Bipolaricaulota bacterium]
DSVAVARPGEKTFQVVSEWVDRVVRVPDSDIMEAFLILMEKHKMVAEPAGAVALAALLNGKLNAKGKVVAVLSGGNIDVVTMSALIERGLVRMGRVFEFSVDLPDRPGQLLAVARILAEQHANVIQIEHNQFENLERFTQVRLTITVETSGHEHIGQITQALKREHYDIVE